VDRRKFIKYGSLASGSLLLPTGLDVIFEPDEKTYKLTILHTNDVHSRIDPFPMDGSSNQGKGGAAKRMAIISKIRAEEKNVLLLDAGDMFQGTAYFNFFKGELEIKLMSQMGYDAATLGNHDFDGGIENLRDQLKSFANFPIINANYQFDDTAMKGMTVPYKIIRKGPLKIGITGIGIELNGLVPKKLCGDTQYLNPLESAEKNAKLLKAEFNCDYVICLSHLGYSYKTDQISDLKLAAASSNIDLIIGGHTHTFLDKPVIIRNREMKEVHVCQVGWAPIKLGKIEIEFDKKSKKKSIGGTALGLSKNLDLS
jgi:5'-nucleotidase